MFPILVVFAYAQDKKYFSCLLRERKQVCDSPTLIESDKIASALMDTDRPSRPTIELSLPKKTINTLSEETLG